MHDTMAGGHKFHALCLTQPVRGHPDRRRDVGDVSCAQSADRSAERLRRLCARMPRARTNPVDLPFEHPAELLPDRKTAKSWNFTLDEPELTTRTVSMSGYAAETMPRSARA